MSDLLSKFKNAYSEDENSSDNEIDKLQKKSNL